MKIIKLVKSEFIKNCTIKKWLIIVFVLLISSIFLTEFVDLSMQPSNILSMLHSENVIYEDNYNSLSKKEELTLKEKYQLYYASISLKLNQYFIDKNIKTIDWKFELGQNLKYILKNNYIIELLQENRNNPTIVMLCENELSNGEFESNMNYYCNNYSQEELNNLFVMNQKTVEIYKNLLARDQFYLYITYLFNTGKINEDNKPFAKEIIEQKVQSVEDFRALYYLQSAQLHFEEFPIQYSKSYYRYINIFNQNVTMQRAILLYSIKHNIKHDMLHISTANSIYATNYITSKMIVNKIFYLSIVVLLIVSISCSGIVSKEHNTGTIKNIITAPIKRWKVLLSKFIYLILYTYIVWFIGLLMLSIYAGIKYGFQDLFTPKLIYFNNKVIEVNYYLYLLKDLFIINIPILAFLCILLFLSTITLNTTITTSITTVLTILAPITYYLCEYNKLFSIFLYTPLPYFNCGFILEKSNVYMEILKQTTISLHLGIFISIVTCIVLYVIINTIYQKRDIKS